MPLPNPQTKRISNFCIIFNNNNSKIFLFLICSTEYILVLGKGNKLAASLTIPIFIIINSYNHNYFSYSHQNHDFLKHQQL